MAGAIASIAAPFVASTVGQIAQSFLGGGGGAGGAGGGGLFGPLLNSFTSAFGPLLGQAANPLGLLSQIPQMFSPSNMSPQTFNDPLSSLRNSWMPHYQCGTNNPGIGGSGGSGDSDISQLSQLSAEADRLGEIAKNNPDDLGAMIAYQKAELKKQNLFNLISDDIKRDASLFQKSLQNSVLN